MRNFLNDLFTQMKGIWARLDAGQKLVVSAVPIGASGSAIT